MGKLRVVPLTLKQANQLVGLWHRHHGLVVGHRWSVGVESDGVLVGAAVVGRPKARLTDQYLVAEVDRLVTNGAEHACSKLYAACARAAQAMGFVTIQTFILSSEPGTSLRAAGWIEDAAYDRRASEWGCKSRKRRLVRHVHSDQRKRRWYKCLA